MLRLHRKKQNDNGDAGEAQRKVESPAVIRLRKELETLDLPQECHISVKDELNIRQLGVTICPIDGFWQNGKFRFLIEVPLTYPHDPPKVKCAQTIFHPNIDVHGRVCLNILSVEWNPVLSMYTVIVGLLHLFLAPQTGDPLNKEAAELLEENERNFVTVVRKTMRGGVYNGRRYDEVMGTSNGCYEY